MTRHQWTGKGLYTLLVCGISVLAAMEATRKTIPISDARGIVYVALSKKTRQLPGVSVVPGKAEDGGRCITFDVLWSNSGPGSAHIEFYTVDLQTAALWRGPRPPTEVEDGPRVVKRQLHLRRQLGLAGRVSKMEIEQSPCWK